MISAPTTSHILSFFEHLSSFTWTILNIVYLVLFIPYSTYVFTSTNPDSLHVFFSLLVITPHPSPLTLFFPLPPPFRPLIPSNSLFTTLHPFPSLLPSHPYSPDPIFLSLLLIIPFIFYLYLIAPWSQRSWGVPIPVFYKKSTNEALMNAEILEHVEGAL